MSNDRGRSPRAHAPAQAEDETTVQTLDLLSTVPVHGTRFLELQGRHPPGSIEDLKLRFTRRVIFLSRRWRNSINEELRKTGQSHARWTALMWIHLLGGKANHGELADRIGVEPPTLIRLLNRLESEGLVERFALGAAGRAKSVRLTPEGRRVLAELNNITDRVRAAFLEGVDLGKLEVCMSLFDDLLAQMSEE